MTNEISWNVYKLFISYSLFERRQFRVGWIQIAIHGQRFISKRLVVRVIIWTIMSTLLWIKQPQNS